MDGAREQRVVEIPRPAGGTSRLAIEFTRKLVGVQDVRAILDGKSLALEPDGYGGVRPGCFALPGGLRVEVKPRRRWGLVPDVAIRVVGLPEPIDTVPPTDPTDDLRRAVSMLRWLVVPTLIYGAVAWWRSRAEQHGDFTPGWAVIDAATTLGMSWFVARGSRRALFTAAKLQGAMILLACSGPMWIGFALKAAACFFLLRAARAISRLEAMRRTT